MKLDIRSFSLACAVVWGAIIFLITWWIIIFEGSSDTLIFIGRIYRGYRVTPLGSLIGLIWGFIDGLIFGAIFSWLYNMFSGRHSATE